MKSSQMLNLGGSSFTYFDLKFASEKLMYETNLDMWHELKSVSLASLEIPEWHNFLEKNTDHIKTILFQLSQSNFSKTYASTSKLGLIDNTNIEQHKISLKILKRRFVERLRNKNERIVCILIFER